MKRFFLFVALATSALFASAQDERVLLTVNGEPSTVSEFLYIYNKNQQDTANRQSIDEYLEMFINFKLKVAAAKEQGLDTMSSFQKELIGYRKQAIPRYMVDSASQEALIAATYQSMLTDRYVRHIAIQCPYSANDSAIAAAMGKIMIARERVTTGIAKISGKGRNRRTTYTPEDFAAVAAEISDDPTAKENGGLVGWVSPFRFVYSFEKAAYQTPVGEVSEVFRTPYGFHILKVENEVPHKEVSAAHIMKMTPLDKGDDAVTVAHNDSVIRAAKGQIDLIYKRAKSGEDFATLAATLSDDRGTSQRGGNLGWFSRGVMVKAFEDVAFSMSEEGSLSEPFRSDYGWHIMQYNGARGTASLEQSHDDILKKIMRDERRRELDEAFVSRLKKEYGFAENPAAIRDFYSAAQGCQKITDSLFVSRIGQLSAFMFKADGKTFTQADFAQFLKENSVQKYGSMQLSLDDKYAAFVEREMRQIEDSHLEEKYPELRNLVREYHDGIMLFDISLKEVWDRATQDTAGLTRYFEEHKADYLWQEPRFKGWLIHAKDQRSLKAAKSIIKNSPADSVANFVAQRVNVDKQLFVHYDHKIWQKAENAEIDRYGFKLKKTVCEVDSAFPYVAVIGKTLKGAEEYEDERGKVVADYQDYLEKEWLRRLHEKYQVVVNKEVLEDIKKKF